MFPHTSGRFRGSRTERGAVEKIKNIFHPIIVFIGVQIAWIILMAIWIRWYLKNRQDFKAFAERLQPELFASDLNWVVLLEGCFLMILILGGFYVIFLFWNKQAKLIRMQTNFVSSMTHELKSPLASIQLYLETLKYHKVSPEEQQDFVETMLNDTERLSGLIENILRASHPDPKRMKNEFQPVDLKELLEEVVENHQASIRERQVELSLELERVPEIMMDKRSMRMVFNNLIGNSFRYTLPGQKPFLRIRLEGDERNCYIVFEDKGVGLSEYDMKRIFRKFYRVQIPETQNIVGAGLGLFISNEIVRYHGGKITVVSEGKGKGSMFTVHLPLSWAPESSFWDTIKERLSGIFGSKEKAHLTG